ncbi:MAG: gamma-glutamyl-gamma-aminobutyrate hydrolase family protein [Actinomycetota bacterium]|nr:gamma-glutamyl-gamma-aminobutyrate hydrolase family protein [Actinomycetota bacterium]
MTNSGRPLIGVTTSEVRKAETLSPIPEGEPPMHEMALGITYMRAIEAGGGVPVVIPPLGTDLIGPLLSRLDGLCLSGGPDIHPGAYDQEPHEKLGPTEPDLDRFELTIAHWADLHGLPILAICRGMQALNVSRGGSLFQHIPDRWDQIDHRQTVPGHTASHQVDLDPEARLSTIFGSTEIAVNSFHHQAVDRIGENLTPSGWSPDGAVEAVEDRSREFLIGVQWHAELLVDDSEHLRLYTAFVDACIEFGQERLSGIPA